MANRLGNWFHGEREKLRELTAKEKVQYIWSYYYLWIIGISAFLTISIFLTVRITTSIKEEWLYAMFANTRADAGNGSAMWKDFTEFSGLDLKEKRVEFNAEAYFDYLKNQAKGNDYYCLADHHRGGFYRLGGCSIPAACRRQYGEFPICNLCGGRGAADRRDPPVSDDGRLFQ